VEKSRILKTGATLCAITAVAALLLAVVNSVTAPIIAENTAEKTQAAMKNVMSDAQSFDIAEFSPSDSTEDVTEVYAAKKADGSVAGYCVSVSPNGYGGAIDMIVGIGSDFKVTGVDIISQSETAGLGAKSTEPEFRDQYVGKGTIDKVVKSGAAENEINAISSATITSKAVTKGVNEAISAAELIGKN
jgi:electron transport complex protein RnfG